MSSLSLSGSAAEVIEVVEDRDVGLKSRKSSVGLRGVDTVGDVELDLKDRLCLRKFSGAETFDDTVACFLDLDR